MISYRKRPERQSIASKLKAGLLASALLLFAQQPLFAVESEHDQMAEQFYLTQVYRIRSENEKRIYKERFSVFKKSYPIEAAYAYSKLVDSTISKNIPKKLYIDIIKKELSVEDLKKIRIWFDTPIGKKVYQEEKKYLYEVEGASKYIQEANKSRNSVDHEREDLIYRLVKSFGIIEVISSIIQNRSDFFNQFLFSPENRKLVEEHKTNMSEVRREFLFMRQLERREYVMRNFSNEELRQYAQFLGTDIGRRYYQVVRRFLIERAYPRKMPTPITQQELPKIAKMINRDLPKMVGTQTRLDLCKSKNSTLVYHYTLKKAPGGSKNRNLYVKNLEEVWKNKICRKSTMALYPMSGISLRHVYFDTKKNIVANINVTPAFCGL